MDPCRVFIQGQVIIILNDWLIVRLFWIFMHHHWLIQTLLISSYDRWFLILRNCSVLSLPNSGRLITSFHIYGYNLMEAFLYSGECLLGRLLSGGELSKILNLIINRICDNGILIVMRRWYIFLSCIIVLIIYYNFESVIQILSLRLDCVRRLVSIDMRSWILRNSLLKFKSHLGFLEVDYFLSLYIFLLNFIWHH